MTNPVLDGWFEDRSCRLRTRGTDPARSNRQERPLQLGLQVAREFLDHFWDRWDNTLNAGHGGYVLRQPNLADIIAHSRLHFDQERSAVLDFVIIPSHIHLLASFPEENTMLAQCES